MATTGNDTNSVSDSAMGNGQPPQQAGGKVYIANRARSYNPFQEVAQPIEPIPEFFHTTMSSSPKPSAAPTPTPAPVVPVAEPVYVKPETVLPPSAPDNYSRKSGPGCNPLMLIWAPFKAIFKLLAMIKNLIFTALVLIVLAIVATFLILMYRPPLVWNPIKTSLNNGVEKPEYQNIDTQVIFKKVNSTALSDKPVTLDDSEFTSLMREYTFLGDKCFVGVQDKGMRFYINIDTSDRPLWFIIDTKLNDKNRFIVDKAGFGLFDTPQQFTSLLTDTMGQLFQFLEKQVTADSSVTAFDEVVNKTKLDKNLKLQQVELKKGSVVLYYLNSTPKSTTLHY